MDLLNWTIGLTECWFRNGKSVYGQLNPFSDIQCCESSIQKHFIVNLRYLHFALQLFFDLEPTQHTCETTQIVTLRCTQGVGLQLCTRSSSPSVSPSRCSRRFSLPVEERCYRVSGSLVVHWRRKKGWSRLSLSCSLLEAFPLTHTRYVSQRFSWVNARRVVWSAAGLLLSQCAFVR